MKVTHWIAMLGAPLFACATAGTNPHEMSAAQHEAAAGQEERAAAGHQAEYTESGDVLRERCIPGGGAFVRTGPWPGACWTSLTNTTDFHRRAAEAHRRAADEHHAASAALLDAEAKACAGLSPNDRDISPFEHREDIAGVEPLRDVGVSGFQPLDRPTGAIVTFRAVPGMSTEWLQRVVDCHLARNAASGHEVPEMPDCPLVPVAVTAKVTSTGNGFAVAIRSENPAAAKEVLDRAQRLVGAGPVSSHTPASER